MALVEPLATFSTFSGSAPQAAVLPPAPHGTAPHRARSQGTHSKLTRQYHVGAGASRRWPVWGCGWRTNPCQEHLMFEKRLIYMQLPCSPQLRSCSSLQRSRHTPITVQSLPSHTRVSATSACRTSSRAAASSAARSAASATALGSLMSTPAKSSACLPPITAPSAAGPRIGEATLSTHDPAPPAPAAISPAEVTPPAAAPPAHDPAKMTLASRAELRLCFRRRRIPLFALVRRRGRRRLRLLLLPLPQPSAAEPFGRRVQLPALP